MNGEVKKVFSPKPIISFRSAARKLSSYLVRTKLYLIEQLDHLNVPKSTVKYAKMYFYFFFITIFIYLNLYLPLVYKSSPS